MRGLAERLARGRRVIRVDWPGLGESDRFAVRYRSPLYVRFLAAFLEDVGKPVDVVAAGHGASYALEVSRTAPGRFHRLALLAPTWRGPLPTAMGPHPRAWGAAEWLVRAPLIGSLLYGLNSSRGFIRWMMSRHVYAQPAHITEALLDDRVRTAHGPNARFAAGAFVTGRLDAYPSRERFLEAALAFPAPLLVGMGARTPPKSLGRCRRSQRSRTYDR